uniref:Uncharacterized protein n=1 Tax=Pseudictyota dubia TaxID=2749911 RepID=A0A7R9VYS9_9STRA|mmetsp:Transcript_25766/g.48010  ORF Transcript_25766/g.48010 Transcript_25766/m.48010 type:complete len:100 (+) Transcript_25766:43-342(+)
MSWLDNLKRAVGLKATFRRTGASIWPNVLMGAFVGVISGQYMFKEPLEQYWAEQRRLEAENGGGGSGSVSSSSKGSSGSTAVGAAVAAQATTGKAAGSS